MLTALSENSCISKSCQEEECSCNESPCAGLKRGTHGLRGKRGKRGDPGKAGMCSCDLNVLGCKNFVLASGRIDMSNLAVQSQFGWTAEVFTSTSATITFD